MAAACGEQNLLIAGMVAAALGIIALVCAEGAVALTIGMLLVGAGFGMAQNASLSLMFENVPASGYDMVSAIWNLAYDAGWDWARWRLGCWRPGRATRWRWW